MRYKLLLFTFLLTSFAAQAQSKFSNKPAEFITEAKALMVTGKVTNAEQLGTELEGIWNSGKLTDKQKNQVIDISQQMYRKKMRSNPHYSDFFTMITAGVNKHDLRGDRLSSLLDVVAKAVDNEDMASVGSFLNTSSLYLTTGRIFQKPNYRLYATGGSFSFAYEGASSKKEDDKAAQGSSEWDNISWDDEVSSEAESTDDGWGTPVVKPKSAEQKKEEAKKAAQRRKESLKQQFIPAQPQVSGPTLKLENVNITFATNYDSTAIQKTSGQLMLTKGIFVGEGGTYDWEAGGSQASAIIRKYNFDVTFAGFKAPDVTLTYKAVLDSPVEGSFEFRSTKRGAKGEKLYPRFVSFTNDAKVKSLGEKISYTGGFSLAGDLIGSRALDGSLSEISVVDGGKRKFSSRALNYTLNDSVIVASQAAVSIYQEKDSISHVAVQLRYSKPLNRLTLTKDKGPYSRTPFYDTYHEMEIVAERVYWDLNTPHINFSVLNTKTIIPVQLESTEYYSNNRYQQLVGVATFHPLQALVAYAQKSKQNEFYAADVSKFNKINEQAIRQAAHNLSREGFLDFDNSTGYIALKKKAWLYVGASKKKRDYDHIVIRSVVPSGRNATLNMNNNKLEVRGVEKIAFNNDTASVYIVPDSSIVRILDNRNIEFGGQVFASRLAFKGSKFKFDYDEFMIDMQQLDTIALVTKKRKSSKGEVSNQVLTSRTGSLTGKLYINKPENKSGKEFYPEYPKFDAPVGAQVAFNRPDVLGGAYDSTVYFDMPPFKLDSLSSGKNTIGFEGTFHSGGIFPDIKTKLIMMPDETLGFYYQPPAKGLPAFGGKGIAYDTIMMSSQGIQSKGTLTYLTATLEAPEYTYYQDAVKTQKGAKATIKEDKLNSTEFPVATLSNFNMNWQPKVDSMYLYTNKEPMLVYKEQYKFKGVAKLSPGGMYGTGELDNPVANVTSPQFLFKQRSFSGNNSQMIAKSDVQVRPAIKAQGVEFNYDMTKGAVDFGIEKQGAASIEFPRAQYKTSMRSARWDFATEKITLKADEKGGKNYFYSMHPEQDSLNFMAGSGVYDLKKNTILAGGVPYIAVADMYVLPDSGKVVVSADATIRTLRNSRIMADSAQQYHKLYEGNVDVKARKLLKGNAYLDYLNAASDSFKLHFSDFTYDNPQGKRKPIYSFATANIEEKDKFYIFPRILYRGKVLMHATKPYMDFDGELKLTFTGNETDSGWFPYKKDTLNPANVRIPIQKPKAADGTPLHTGIHVSAATAKLYNTFVSQKQNEDDLDLFLVDGSISYNKANKEFKIEREERANANSYQGNVLSYSEATNNLRFEGKLNLLKSSRNFKVDASGNGSANVDSSRYNLDTFLAFNFEMPEQALVAMAENLEENTQSAPEALDGSDATYYKLGEFIGDRGVRNYINQTATGHVPLPKLDKSLIRSLILNKVDLQWSNEQKAWYSTGKIGVASIMKEDINAMVDGYLEIKQDLNGEPTMNLYLQADQYTWYYFSFFENGLNLVASNDKFNKAVKSKSKRGRGTTTNYAFYPGEATDKNIFLEHFSKNYLNGKSGFKVATQQQEIESTESMDFVDEEPKKEKKRRKKKGEAPEGEPEPEPNNQ
ncbi:hypothetical protein H8S95_17615 [Pontibacter sp. KCTC 32443]|uniref:hypothetical protein n=1 Tax=Pontibacter TaxID=323449 RepID=UPI00164D59A9|nr:MULTISPECIES: hypothetical protein [Pontibacter]MBC5775897.1 hypothetical protein [Pontibacter sp. KCTC 32443]